MRRIKDMIICVLAPLMYLFRIMFHRATFRVLDVDDTINALISTEKSLSRFGDGETSLIRGHNLRFQKCSPEIQQALVTVLSSQQSDVMVGIPPIFSISSLMTLKPAERRAWIRDMLFTYPLYKRNCKGETYYSSLVSRLYLPYEVSREITDQRFRTIKKLWNDKDIVIVEGKFSKLGVGNDLFLNAKSIKRIICPEKDAFEQKHRIMEAVNQLVEKENLVLLALGPTATVLAYELAQCGYRAIDIGHLDIEYEWFLNKANEKTAVKGKFVNEANDRFDTFDNIDIMDDAHHKQIVCVID